MTDKQPEALEKIAKALLVVAQLCDGTKRWTMSVPARPDSDPDLVLADALREAYDLLRTQHAAIERKDALLRQAADAMYEAQTYTGSASRSPSMTKDLQALCLAITSELAK